MPITKTIPVPLDFSGASNGSVPFRHLESVVAAIRHTYPEDEQQTCLIHGIGALTCTIEHTLSPIEAAQETIAALQADMQRARAVLPRPGEGLSADQVEALREALQG